MTVEQLTSTNPSTEVLRQEEIDVGTKKVGFIAARYNSGVDRILTQQAIFRADPLTFFVLQLISPGQSKADADNNAGVDLREAAAARTFEQILPTVQMLDREALRQEQNERLYRTKELFVQWEGTKSKDKDNEPRTPPLEQRMVSVLVPEQWVRVIRDGKDVGYLKITEQTAEHANHPGVEITVRSHVEADPRDSADKPTAEAVSPDRLVPSIPTLTPGAPTGAEVRTPHLDRVAQMFVTLDRMHEDWTIITTSDDGRRLPLTTTEMGNSDKEVRKVLDTKAVKEHVEGDKEDPKNPPTIEKQRYTLSVNTYAKIGSSKPIERDLPVFYLPQAIGQLLPRLLPLDEQRTYMFASYISDQREVMSRYVDVLREQDATIGNRQVRAIPVKDRIGVEGSATTHYMSREGQWLGSVNEEQKITVMPSDEAEVKQIWHEIKLPADAAATGEQTVGKVR
jgi:hypothetical protein